MSKGKRMFKIRELKLREKMRRIKRFLLLIFQKASHFIRNKSGPLIKRGLSKIRTCFAGPCFIRFAHKIKVKKFLKGREALGLDIGTSSIKVARLLKTRKGVRLLNFWEKEIPREERSEAGDETIARTIGELLSQIHPAPSQKIISSLPASSSVIKGLSLPFKGKRKIRQVIRYEMEPYLPFSLEETIIDFYIIDDHLPDRTLVLAFALNKKVIKRHLKILDMAGIKSEIVDLDSTSLFNVYALKEDKETVALINLGAEQTIVNIMSEKRFLFTRSIMKAGDDISQTLAERLGASFKEAEELKREGLDEEKSKVIKPVLNEIIKEIEYTFSSFLAFYPDKSIEKILLTGGSARLPGIVEYFQKSLNIGTSLFNPFQKPPPTKLSLSGLKEFFIPSLKEISTALNKETLDGLIPLLSQSMGIALRGMARTRASLNFIREEKPLIKRLEEARPFLKPATILLISILLLGLLDFYSHLYLKKRKGERLKEEIRVVFKNTFPEIKIKKAEEALAKMKDGLEKREEDLALSPREFSSLSILREISSLTPQELGVTLEDLSVDWDETRIRGRTSVPDFSLVDRFKKALENSTYFSEIKVSDAHLSKGKRSVEFRMTIKYGK